MLHIPILTRTRSLRLAALTALAALTGLCALHADEIQLKDGHLIKGNITALNDQGEITFTSPHSSEPITLRANHFQSITLGESILSSEDKQAPDAQPSQITRLINGDFIVASINKITDQSITLSGKSLPETTIPRQHLDYVQFGHTIHKLVYDGPKKLADWKSVSGFTLHDGELLSSQRGRAALEKTLPQNFALDFNLAWDEGLAPKFKYHFCSTKTSPYSSGAWYYLSINNRGVSIYKKNSDSRSRYTSLSNISFKPSDFPENKLHVSLRCNRDNGTIFLYLDGKLADSIYGLEDIPKGNNIILESNGDNNSINRFTNFDIYEWNSIKPTQNPSQREKLDQDSFLNNEGDLYTGTLLGLKATDAADPTFQFRNIHTPKPFDIHPDQLTFLFFAQKEEVKGTAVHEEQPYRLHLKDGGQLQIKDPIFNKESLQATHPILGPITLPKEQLGRLTLE